MSLGYNFNRNPRYSNLGGNTGANIIPTQQMQKVVRRRARSPNAVPVNNGSASSAAQMKPDVSPPLSFSFLKQSPTPTTPAVADDLQFVYATANADLCDVETQEVVATKSERTMLVYPQRVVEETGCVEMKLKRAHPVTGQLKLHWVTVYDPGEQACAHLASDFSLVP